MSFLNWIFNQVSKTYGNIADTNTAYQMSLDLFNENLSQKQFCKKYKGSKQIYINYHEGMKNNSLPFSRIDAQNEVNKIYQFLAFQQKQQNLYTLCGYTKTFSKNKYNNDYSYLEEEEANEELEEEEEEEEEKEGENESDKDESSELESYEEEKFEEEEEEEDEEEEEEDTYGELSSSSSSFGYEEKEENTKDNLDFIDLQIQNGNFSEHEKDGKLHFYAINVGFGNLFILSIGIKAVIIDAGTNEITNNMEINNNSIPDSLIVPAITILKTKQIQVAVITHPSKDHYNLLKSILEKSDHDINKIQIICGGYQNQYNDFISCSNCQFSFDLNELEEEKILLKKQEFEKILNKFFSKENVCFNFLIPVHFNQNDNLTDNFNEDYCNLLLAVDYKDKRILISGDATQNTINSLCYSDIQYLKNVDVFIVPNHGSNPKTEGNPLYIRSKIAIVSSDPDLYQCYLNGCPNSDYISELIDIYDSESPIHKIFVWQRSHSPTDQISDHPVEQIIKAPLFSVSNYFFKYDKYCFNGIHLVISRKNEIDFKHTEIIIPEASDSAQFTPIQIQ
ncbi:hypothetical protein M9Y10_001524 [Tritrichomonas musculus]|uniref:Metallo-beta-lactamase domain-containing protein n=1 Tax=Tritrichomonas musculus TaxID=1915356 RepID=A0ABR2L780_9EUKA